MYDKGEKVRFTPKEPTLNCFAGIRTIKRIIGEGLIQLECGNIVLVAKRDEITKL